ncbi:glutamine synthetase family protein [Cognatishimia sp. F0-27]|uniref:glutamine synthetase family protein n=1 Tax=Cognatishimia sp. F0-27 TaxID=2816855 RepID=UPI001D0C39CA|nr:glutamine synthetase family protein [Cognatishimia sp. F0-27]
MACTSDFSGLVRGKGFLSSDLSKRIQNGVGWTPTNVQITCFDSIADSPYGALGDMVLWPDPETRVETMLPDGAPMSFLMGPVTDLDGAPWECCTRSILHNAIETLRAETGLTVKATFEHEFMLSGGRGSRGFTLDGFQERRAFSDALVETLGAAGIEPDSILREYGPDQMEITLPPTDALKAADQATALREITRAVARALDTKATFSPLCAPDIVGNGVHIHFSLWDAEGHPATHDPAGQDGLSPQASAFIAGILRHANGVTALTAPSVLSYERLVPHRWSAGFNNLGAQDREALIRICPVSAREPDARARQFNVEFRAADAAASPYLALAALLSAGTIGLRETLSAPAATTEDLSLLDAKSLADRGLARLPQSLEEAIAAFEADETLRACFPDRMPAIYAAHKRGEIDHVKDLSNEELFAAYAATY